MESSCRVGRLFLVVLLAIATACVVEAEGASSWVDPDGRFTLELSTDWKPHDAKPGAKSLFEGDGATVEFAFRPFGAEPLTLERAMTLKEAELAGRVAEAVLVERFDVTASRFSGQLALFEIPTGPMQGSLPVVGCVLLDKGAVTIQAAISNEESLAALVRLVESIRQVEGGVSTR